MRNRIKLMMLRCSECLLKKCYIKEGVAFILRKNNRSVHGFIGFGVAVIIVGILIDDWIATTEKEVGAFTRTEFS